MIGTALLASVPFRNPTALADYIGTLTMIHQDLAETISRQTASAVKLYPLGTAYGDSPWLFALEQQHADEARALGIAPPPSFADFELSNEAEWASFTFLVSQDLERIRLAAGVV